MSNQTNQGNKPYMASLSTNSSKPRIKFNWKSVKNNVFKLFKLYAKLIASAAIWMAFFHFVPELEEYIPSIKTFCGWILTSAEFLFSFVVNLLQKLL